MPRRGDQTAARQTAVWLADEELAWLDSQLHAVKHSGGWRGITRSALIRALIRVAMARTPDLGGAASEQELVERLRTRLSGPG